jgi:hypothetical protein
MEFWTSIWRKYSSLLLHATHSLSSPWRIFKETQGKQTLLYSWIAWCGKMREENPTKTRVWEDLSLCLESSSKNAVQEFHLQYPPLFCNFNSQIHSFWLGLWSPLWHMVVVPAPNYKWAGRPVWQPYMPESTKSPRSGNKNFASIWWGRMEKRLPFPSTPLYFPADLWIFHLKTT